MVLATPGETPLPFPWLLAAIPLGSVAAGLVGEVVTPTPRTSALLIYAAAGVLTVALAADLLPPLLALSLPTAWPSMLAAVMGLIGGTVLMALLRTAEERKGTDARPGQVNPAPLSPLPSSQPTAGASSTRTGDAGERPQAQSPHDIPFRRPRYPTAAVTAVLIDIFMDGVIATLTVSIMGGISIPLTLALTLDDAAGSLAIVERLRLEGIPMPKRLITAAGLGIAGALGIWVGWIGRRFLHPQAPATVALFGLSVAVVTWLIFEELIVQVSQVPGLGTSGQIALIAGMLVAIALQWLIPKTLVSPPDAL